MTKEERLRGPFGRNVITAFFWTLLSPALVPLVILVLFPSFAAGEEGAVQIRVSLPLPKPTVSIQSQTQILISALDAEIPNAQKLSRLEITLGSSGLTLNGQSTSLQEVQIQTLTGGLIINDLPVAGRLTIRRKAGSLQVINTLPLEEYLKGVVPVEVSALWHPELLKVQAIISRTYALYQKGVNRGEDYDLVSSTLDQVYRGKEREHPASNKAISETRGVVLTYGGQVIQSFFHSTSAGPTENALEVWGVDLPYLKGVSCPLDEGSPYFDWTASFPMEQLAKGLLQEGFRVGTIAAVAPLHWTAAGRVKTLQIIHSLGEITLKGNDFRRILGYSKLPSTRFIIEKVGPKLRVRGLGAGHAVGLCQWGSKQMAEMGTSHKSILQHYYPGAKLQKFSNKIELPLLP